MRKLYTLFLAVVLTSGLSAQTPQKMSYQAVIRNSSDALVTNHLIGMKISILQGSSTGTPVYVETQTTTTNANGLASIEIGAGTTSGDFSAIDWSAGPYFIKTETDPAGGVSYSITGTSQLLSVPYALHAKTAEKAKSSFLSFYTMDEIITLSPSIGETVFNTTESLYQIFDGNRWLSLPANCWPQPTTSNAGAGQFFTDVTVSTKLSANTPEAEHGTGQWSIVSGDGGSFNDDTSPTAVFTGQECTSYQLQWTITTSCSSSSDIVNITFNQTPTVADAGADQTFTHGPLSTTLAANTPEAGHGTGQWSIVSGDGGSFDDPSDPNTTFSGTSNERYYLRWTISTNCQVSEDDVMISLDDYPEKMYMIGASVGGWDWATNAIEMVPAYGNPHLFWRIVWLQSGMADPGFKFSPEKAWGKDFGKEGDAVNGVYAKGTSILPDVAVSGYYNVVVNLKTNTIEVNPAKVYGIGDAFGGWDAAKAANVFTEDAANKLLVSPATVAAGNLRMHVTSATMTKLDGAVIDWWRAEFNIIDGQIEYRGNGGDQAAVPVTTGKVAKLNFSTGTGTIQ